MGDTVRTRAQILADLANNTSGDITPQVMRNLLVSVMGVYGAILGIDNVVTQALTADTWAKLTKYTEDGLSVETTPDYVNGDLQIDHTGVYQIYGKISPKVDASNVVLLSQIRVDDVTRHSGFHTKLGAAGDETTGSMMGIVSLNAGEKLSLWIKVDQNCNLTAEHTELIAIRIG